jgi:hypothetical protein
VFERYKVLPVVLVFVAVKFSGKEFEKKFVTKVRLKILFLFNYEDILQATKKSLLHLQVQRKRIRYKKRSLRNRKTPKKR